MFSNPTVFVLGAGVSMPHGFPSGVGLINAICKQSAGDQKNFIKLLELANPDRSESFIEEFIQHLAGSGLYSIDAWLEGNPDYMSLGKTAIAALIWEAEHRAIMEPVLDSSNWFRWLWSKMYTPDIHDLIKNDVCFITFNYDRFLEYKLLTSIRHSYPQKSVQIQMTVFESLIEKIVHVHGKLKVMTPDSYGNIGIDTYKGSVKLTERAMLPQYEELAKRIVHLAASINIVSESANDKQLEAVAINLLQTKSKRIFLGFSYDKRNVQRLQIEPIVNGLDAARGGEIEIVAYPMVGTSYGLELAEQIAIKNQFGGRIHFGENTLNAVSFCRKYILAP